jgi:hypothetical protein
MKHAEVKSGGMDSGVQGHSRVKKERTGKIGMSKEYEDLDRETLLTLMELPDHLRKSAAAVIKLRRATAENVAKETGRAKALESAYLNQLARMGYLERIREGHKVFFRRESYEKC